jgi:hypothetical protein
MEDFVPFELAKKLEEKGFQIKFKYALGYYDTRGQFMTAADHWFLEYWTIAPTISQVLKWLREEKKIHFEFVAAAYGYNVIISQTPDAGGTDYYYTHMNDDGPNDGGAWDRYEDAAIYCIKYVLDNLI